MDIHVYFLFWCFISFFGILEAREMLHVQQELRDRVFPQYTSWSKFLEGVYFPILFFFA